MRRSEVASFVFLLIAIVYAAGVIATEDSICAQVKIEIKQELTLERQAFDAHMRINNGIDTQALENIDITVSFKDDIGMPVVATSDPNDTSAAFFIRVDSMVGVSNITGTGSIAPATSADIHWLIIPAPGSAAGVPNGKLYFVGATLKYSLGGEAQSITVTPDTIYVKPLPLLTLDYFLTKDVYADDAFTSEIEPAEPFTLGVRVKNTGSAAAKQLKIESAQPKITENNQGLLIGFQIIGSYVNERNVENSLLVNLGDIPPAGASVGRWLMTTSLSGKFTEFGASFTHSDALGGALTSILQATNAHFLIRDVKVDLAGRDSVRDFLADDAGTLRLYESDGTDTDVTDQSASAVIGPAGGNTTESWFNLSSPPTAGPAYIKVLDPNNGTKALARVTRSDGKVIGSENAWLSRVRNADRSVQHFVHVFDVGTPGNYTLAFTAANAGPRPPVMQFVGDRVVPEGTQVSFIVEASDPDGTVPALSAAPLAIGAIFSDQGTGTGVFDWTPTVGQAGRYPINFSATDGTHVATQTGTITVTPLTPGAPDAPAIDSPAVGTSVSSQQPTLRVAANTNIYDSTSHYQFEVYGDAALTQLIVASPLVAKNTNAGTPWTLTQNLVDNRDYYWRVRSTNGATYSAWAHGRFRVNIFNEAPRAFDLSAPNTGATVDTLTPTLAAMNSVDPDGDAVTYDFEVFSDAALTQRVANAVGVPAHSSGMTTWVITPALTDTTLYYWRATAVDALGLRRRSTVWSFLVNTNNPAPSAPTIAQPATGGVVTATAVDLVVNNATVTDGEPTSYWFELDTVNTFDSISKVTSGAVAEGSGTTRFAVSSLVENTTYYWRVRASDGIGDSAWIIGSFKVDAANDAPAVPTPKNPGQDAAMTTTAPRLEAAAVTDPEGEAVQYRFEVYADAELTARVADVLNALPEWVIAPQLADGQQYFWRVRAEDARTAVSAWSAVQRFVVNARTNNAPVITLTSPTSIVQSSGAQYALTWEIQDPANNSTVSLYRDTDGQGADGALIAGDIVQDAATSAGSYLWDVSQLAPGTYYVYAVANNGAATDTRYAPGSLVVPAAQPRGVITVSNASSAQTTEAGGSATFSIVLGNSPNADVTLSLASTNTDEGRISPTSVTFTRGNWNVPQVVTVTGVADCAVDGNQAYQATIGKAVSADPNYHGLDPADIELTNVDAAVTCNTPPTVTVGADQGVDEGGNVTLSGSATDTGGSIASYAWTQLSGPAVALTGANQQTATFVAPAVTADTVLSFRLAATDNEGATGSATTNVTVRNVNQLPSANAGVAQTVNENTAVTLVGSGSDPDGTIATYQWSQVSGTTVVMNNANTAEMAFVAPSVTANTTLTFQLMVTDNDGGTATATTSVTVVNVNQVPVANAGAAQTVNENVQVTLTGSGSDADGTVATYAWTQSAGPAVTIVNPATANASFIAPAVTADTVLTFQLTVTDNEGAAGVASTNVTVRNVNQAPVANAGVDQTVGEGTAVTLSGSATDADGSIASYAWSQTAGPAVTLTNANTAQAGFTAPEVTANTLFTFQLTAVDNEGAAATSSVNVTVVSINKAPVVSAGGDQSVSEGASVALSGSATDADGTVASYAWTQIAGPTATLTNANTASASFIAPEVTADATLTFQLTATDEQGATGNDTVDVVVTNTTPANTAPVANAGPDQTVNEGSTVTLTGTGTDTDGTIASYAWTQTGGLAVTLTGANTATATFTAPTPSTATTLSFQLTVTDDAGHTGIDTMSVTVNAPVGQVAYRGTPAAIPGIIETENYDEGGSGVAYYDTGAGNDGGAYRNTDVDVQASTDATGGYNLGWTAEGEWIEYTVNVTTAGVYTPRARVASPGAGGKFHIDMDGVTIANFSIPNTDGWQTWQTLTAPAVNLTAGQHVMRLVFDTRSYETALVGNINYIEFVAGSLNANPVANAGPNQTVNEGTTATLSGSATDSDGSIASYAWTQTAGPTVTLTNANTATATFTAPQVPAYTDMTFQLTVTDDAGNTHNDMVKVTVANIP